MKLAFFNFFTFAAIACIQTQLIPFLNELEITSIHKSWVLGISALIALLIAIIIGKISDSTGKMKPSFLISLLLYNLFFIGTIAFKPLSIRLIFFTLMLACLKQVMACAETMVFQIKQDKFGKYQIMSAFGLVFGSLLSGYLFQSFKAIALAIACMVFSCLSGGLTRKFQESKKAKQSVTFNQVKKLF